MRQGQGLGELHGAGGQGSEGESLMRWLVGRLFLSHTQEHLSSLSPAILIHKFCSGKRQGLTECQQWAGCFAYITSYLETW